MGKIGFKEGPCPVCNYKESHYKQGSISSTVYGQYLEIDCPRCGNYAFLLDDFDEIKEVLTSYINEDELYWFYGFTREQTIIRDAAIVDKIRAEAGSKELLEDKFKRLRLAPAIKINKDKIKENILLAIDQAPKGPHEKAIKLLINYTRWIRYPSALIFIDSGKDYPMAYSANEQEFRYYIEYLSNNKMIEDRGSQIKITIKGWETVSEQKVLKDESQCFVAMWFTNEMNKVYLDHISKAVGKAGYKPIIIPEIKHDNEITSQILAEIRKSKFIIADFTGQRAGVYFEAGFAKGLGLNVIWTCRKDWFDNKEAETEGEYKINGKWEKGIIKEERRTHFDVNHRQFILWEYDTKEKLNTFEEDICNSIVEQFGEGPLKSKGNRDNK